MNKNISDNSKKPCLVQTAQGFTVFYKEKFLYSKYDPSKAILQIIEKLELKPQTIILCVSPLLPYGLKELSQKLPPDSIMLGCEYDRELYDFIIQNNKDEFDKIKNFSFLDRNELPELGPNLLKKNTVYKRIVRIDFSAAAQFNSSFYESLIENCTNAIMTFWANRVTLVKFGRKYSTNFFKNLAFSEKTIPIQKYFASVEKPIFLFGSGESAALGMKKLTKDAFILCADTAAQPLIASGFVPDGIFIEEAQNVISKCFLGIQSAGSHIFAGLSSVHAITRYFKPEDISFFTTEYTRAGFIDRFEKAGILPPKNQPFGSVGITAWYYACLFRKNESVPVYTYGLDFAYSAGRTHTKGAMADNARFINSSRIKPDTNYAAAFCQPAYKNGDMYTTPIMARYKEILMALREGSERYDGVPEALERQKIKSFLQKEKESLQEIKALLTGEQELPPEELQTKLTHMISEREYLYLHFPDGYKFQYTQSFLNRVRVEIEYFLKILS